MARKNTETVETTELSAEAIAARNEIANRPRQSQVRLVDYYNVIAEGAPERLAELFPGDTTALAAAASTRPSTIREAITKAVNAKVEQAVAALTNEDALNGYANFAFDADAFAEKTRVKTPRTKKTVVDKVGDAISSASDEELAALKAMLEERGL